MFILVCLMYLIDSVWYQIMLSEQDQIISCKGLCSPMDNKRVKAYRIEKMTDMGLRVRSVPIRKNL